MKPRHRRKKRERVYWRNGRAWFDGRDFADVGGRQEPLVVEGERLATKDPDVANLLAASRLKELDGLRRTRAMHGRIGTPLAQYVADHLVKKAKAGKVTRDWLDMAHLFLERAVHFFGADRDLVSITVGDVDEWATHLA